MLKFKDDEDTKDVLEKYFDEKGNLRRYWCKFVL